MHKGKYTVFNISFVIFLVVMVDVMNCYTLNSPRELFVIQMRLKLL